MLKIKESLISFMELFIFNKESFALVSLFLISTTFARPISYSGGTTFMQSNDAIKSSINVHYSPTYQYSVGYLSEYFRKDKISLNGIQLNNLIKRWNLADAQGNLYLKSSFGNANQ